MSHTQARSHLGSVMNEVCADLLPIKITRKGKRQAVVIVAQDEYAQLTATAHLLRTPANARRLLSSLQELSSCR